MADRWQTYPIEFSGGLISNLSPLQHGSTSPGSARILTNFEPSTDGGYRRIEGFEKFNHNTVTGQNNILGVVFYKDRAIVARDQSAGDPKLFAGVSGTADSSPAWVDLSTSLTLGTNTSRVRFARYNFNGTDKLYIVDGVGYPLILAGVAASDLSQLSSPSDIEGASHVTEFKDHIFLAKGENLVFSAPFSDTDFTAASGGGTINVGSDITAIIPFREQLIIFSESKINRVIGSSISDFKVQPIADDIGCISGDTVQEIAGDVIFLGPDGLRTLAGTEKIQDFNLASVTKPIQKQIVSLTTNSTSFSSAVIREKSQYRIFGFNTGVSESASKGIIGTQLQTAQGVTINWAETSGIKAYVADSVYVGKVETILFANDDGYVYKMESGNSFDGDNINASFATPYFPITDPRLRKTIYRATVYTEPQGSVSLDFNLRYDLSGEGVVEPETISLNNTSASGNVFTFGSSNAFYGTAIYSGESLQSIFDTQTLGSGFTVSLQFESSGTTPPFAMDAAVIEYGQYGRR